MRRFLVLLVAVSCSASCGTRSSAPSPFVEGGLDAADAADAPPDGGANGDGDADADPTLGGPCLDDKQCDDGIDCTKDSCDQAIARCRNVPDDAPCDDGVYCNGAEVCDPSLGCVAGDPVSCSDDDTCTIDTCVEATHGCRHDPRDVDGDGDPPWNCKGGGDCDDNDPLVSSLAPEICGNGVDDNCNGQIDESPCQSPEYDTCVDALEIGASGTYVMSLAAAASDYSASCAGSGGSYHDVVAALVVPQGPPVDIDVVATSTDPSLAIAAATKCGDPSSEMACGATFAPQSGSVARVRLRSLSPGAYALYVFGTSNSDVTLHVDFAPPQPKPTNETCGTAAALVPGAHVTAPIIDATHDEDTACTSTTGDLVYKLTVPAAEDVDVYATSLDGDGTPSISLRDAACKELTCQTAGAAHVFARAPGPGDYYISVSANAPTDVDLLALLSAPTQPSADETCTGSPGLTPGQSVDASLVGHTDDVQLGCVAGAPDAVYALDLAQPSDVLLVERISSSDTGAVGLARAPCAASDVLSCGTGTHSPVRSALHGLSAGSYRAVAESMEALPVELVAYVRPAAKTVLVPFADTCASAVEIPPTGGLFEGNTANANADYDVGCDLGGQAKGGAPDQMLHLSLSKQERVILDMKGSSYTTLLEVRSGPDCPGAELVQACAAGYYPDKSFLSLLLPAGDYYVQVDGYNGDSGQWLLDVFIADP